jgi:hypothetical protein
VSAVLTAQPGIVISYEPWGEARINFPAFEQRVVTSSIAVVTPGAALAE